MKSQNLKDLKNKALVNTKDNHPTHNPIKAMLHLMRILLPQVRESVAPQNQKQ